MFLYLTKIPLVYFFVIIAKKFKIIVILSV